MRATFIGFTIGLVFSIVSSMVATLTFVPGLISKYLPVVSAKIVGQPVEDDRRMVSFYLEVTKKRAGVPRYYTFYVINQLNQGLPVSAFKGNDDCTTEIEPMLINHASGRTWTTHYCFSLVGVIEPGQSYHVIGETGHTAWPYISMITSPIPDFVPVHQEALSPFGALVPLKRFSP